MPAEMILIPTALERDKLLDAVPEIGEQALEICGFGPIASLAITMKLIEKRRPASISLLGIAGRYGSALDIGEAIEFGRVGLYGVGAGSGDAFRLPAEFGFANWGSEELPIGNTLEISNGEASNQTELLTVTSCADSIAEVQQRRKIFPNALGEDMEGFSVALAGQLNSIPVRIIRGISNDAGNREIGSWEIEKALTNVGRYWLQRRTTG